MQASKQAEAHFFLPSSIDPVQQCSDPAQAAASLPVTPGLVSFRSKTKWALAKHKLQYSYNSGWMGGRTL